MAKTLIGNIKGKDGRGISKIEKTATSGVVDTYTITYTDGTKYTYGVTNADNVVFQRQIVPSAAVESSTTASQAYAAGDYVVVRGVLRKVKSAIAKGSAISDSNSTATTVTGELTTIENSVSQGAYFLLYDDPKNGGRVTFYARGGIATITVGSVTGVNVGTPLKSITTIPKEFRPDDSFYVPLVHRQSNNVGQIWVPGKTYDDPYVYIYAGVAPSGPSGILNSLNGVASWIYTKPDDLKGK